MNDLKNSPLYPALPLSGFKRFIAILAVSMIVTCCLCGQNAKPAPQPKSAQASKAAAANIAEPKPRAANQAASPPPSSNQPSAAALPPIQLDGNAALHHLNEIISWYRHATTGIPSVGLPSDAIYQDNTHELGAEAVRLAFQSAKAESVMITEEQKKNGNPSTETTQQQNLAALESKTSAQIDQLQSQLETVNAQIVKVPAAKRSALISQRDALQGEVELQKALLDAIQKMSKFMETNGE